MLGLLTSKPVLYVCNVEEGSAADRQRLLAAGVEARAKKEGAVAVVDLGQDRIRDRDAVARGARRISSTTLGLEEAGLDRLIRAGYELLDLITYFTVGPKEARAWTITAGTKAPAGGRRDPYRFREGLHPRRDHRL